METRLSQERTFIAEKLLADFLAKPEMLVFTLFLRKAGGQVTRQRADSAFGIGSQIKAAIWTSLIKCDAVVRSGSGFKITTLGKEVIRQFLEYSDLINQDLTKEAITNASKQVKYKGTGLIDNDIQVSASSSFVWASRTVSSLTGDIILVNPHSEQLSQVASTVFTEPPFGATATAPQGPEILEIRHA